MSYTIGIKRKILPGYKKYKVILARLEVFIEAPEPHLALHLEQGGCVHIPRHYQAQIKVFSDYDLHKKAHETIESKVDPKKEPDDGNENG